MVIDIDYSFDTRWSTADACEKLVKEIFEDIEKNPEKYSGEKILFHGTLGSLVFCETYLRGLLSKKEISGLEVRSGDDFNKADFRFDVGEYVREYLAKMSLRF